MHLLSSLLLLLSPQIYKPDGMDAAKAIRTVVLFWQRQRRLHHDAVYAGSTPLHVTVFSIWWNYETIRGDRVHGVVQE
jgi:hypothetical protein